MIPSFITMVKVIFLTFTIKFKRPNTRFALLDGALHHISCLNGHKTLRQVVQGLIRLWKGQPKEE
jgi:hypothetical protein